MNWTQYLEQFIGAPTVRELHRRFDKLRGGACHVMPEAMPTITPPAPLSAPEEIKANGRPPHE